MQEYRAMQKYSHPLIFSHIVSSCNHYAKMLYFFHINQHSILWKPVNSLNSCKSSVRSFRPSKGQFTSLCLPKNIFTQNCIVLLQRTSSVVSALNNSPLRAMRMQFILVSCEKREQRCSVTLWETVKRQK